MKGKGFGLGGAMGITFAIVAIFALAFIFMGPQLTDMFKTTQQTVKAPSSLLEPSTPEEKTTTVSCPDTGKTVVYALATNPDNASLEYTATTLYYVIGDEQRASASTNAGASGTAYAQINANALCGKDVFYLETIDDSNHVYFKSKPFTAEGAAMYLGPSDGIRVPESSDLKFTVYNKVWTELTNSSLSPQQDVATVTAVPVDTSTSEKIAVIEASLSSSSAQFGSDLAKPYVCADFDLSYYDKTGVRLVGGGAVEVSDLPKYCANNGYEKAWQINAIKATTDFDLYVEHPLQDPGTSQDIKLLFVDQHAYEDTNGKIKVGTADDLSNDVGETNRYITISIS